MEDTENDASCRGPGKDCCGNDAGLAVLNNILFCSGQSAGLVPKLGAIKPTTQTTTQMHWGLFRRQDALTHRRAQVSSDGIRWDQMVHAESSSLS